MTPLSVTDVPSSIIFQFFLNLMYLPFLQEQSNAYSPQKTSFSPFSYSISLQTNFIILLNSINHHWFFMRYGIKIMINQTSNISMVAFLQVGCTRCLQASYSLCFILKTRLRTGLWDMSSCLLVDRSLFGMNIKSTILTICVSSCNMISSSLSSIVGDFSAIYLLRVASFSVLLPALLSSLDRLQYFSNWLINTFLQFASSTQFFWLVCLNMSCSLSFWLLSIFQTCSSSFDRWECAAEVRFCLRWRVRFWEQQRGITSRLLRATFEGAWGGETQLSYSVMARSASGRYVAVRVDGWCCIVCVGSFQYLAELSGFVIWMFGWIFSLCYIISFRFLVRKTFALLIFSKIKHGN